MNEGKATRYHRARRRTWLLAALGGVAGLVALLVSGGAVALQDAVRQVVAAAGLSGRLLDVLVAAVYAGGVWIFIELWLFPSRVFQTLILDRHYQLSTVGAARWMSTQCASTLLSTLLVGSAAGLLSLAVRLWPTGWWLGCAVGFAVVTIGVTWVAPVWVIPRLYRLRPLDRPPLVDRLSALAARVGVPALRVDELVVGAATRRAQAALVGLGGSRRILLSDTLLTAYSDDEIEAMAAHELGHHVHRDLWQSLAFEFVVVLTALWSAGWAVTRAGGWFGISGPADPAALPLLALVAGGVAVLALPFGRALARRHERRADRFALRVTRNPAAFASSLRRLGEQNLAEDRPSRLVELFWHSHPPLHRRLDSARRQSRSSAHGTA